jgi:hypothetical protein
MNLVRCTLVNFFYFGLLLCYKDQRFKLICIAESKTFCKTQSQLTMNNQDRNNSIIILKVYNYYIFRDFGNLKTVTLLNKLKTNLSYKPDANR